MTVLVVYESMYGSTKQIAEAIAQGLAPAGPVRVVEVGDYASAPRGRAISVDVDLLVAGGPTHAFGLSRPSTRKDAAKDAPDGHVISGRRGLREWLDELTLPMGGTRFVTFDTKVARPKLPGSAAKSAEKTLTRLGGRRVAPPRSFWVEGKTGLVDGQLEEAERWGAELASTLAGV
jgi:hypothetical protein